MSPKKYTMRLSNSKLEDLSHLSRSTVNYMMQMGCFMKIFPYDWDPITYQMKPGKGWKMLLYRFHQFVGFWTFTFVTFRFFQTIKIEDFSTRVRVMNVIWMLAYSLLVGCNYQFDVKRSHIMFFANSLFQDRDRARIAAKATMKTEDVGKVDWRSIGLIIGFFMLMVNPPAHCTLLITMQCAPFYLSSLILQCDSPLHLPLTFCESLPFVIVENFVITEMMFVLAFNWTMIYEGMNWIRDRSKDCARLSMDSEFSRQLQPFEIPAMNFRQVQFLTVLINHTFQHYLMMFPCVVFSTAGLLLFGAMRYTNLTFDSYIAFPFCGFRCLFESLSAMSAASKANQESAEYLEKSLKQIDSLENKNEQMYLRRFYKSCKNLKCTSGSLYTFDNSIVIVSLNNCLQLTLNMLVTYQ